MCTHNHENRLPPPCRRRDLLRAYSALQRHAIRPSANLEGAARCYTGDMLLQVGVAPSPSPSPSQCPSPPPRPCMFNASK